MCRSSNNSAITKALSDRPREDIVDWSSIIDYPISTNLVVTSRCNYNCRFCFGRFRSLCGHIDDSRMLEIPELLAEAGTKKITFEGGEPMLHPLLLRLVVEAKRQGLITGLVTNGSLLNTDRLEELSGSLDWLGLSIDSASELVEKQLGRGFGNHVKNSLLLAECAHEMNISLKVNSVITKLNYQEDLSKMIRRMAPARFKAFQMLSIIGENDTSAKDLEITSREFKVFIDNHMHLNDDGIDFVPETQGDMVGTYIMMLPDGRFFNNIGHVHTYGKHTIFEVGVKRAFLDIQWDATRFLERGGLYDWNINKRDIPDFIYSRKIRVYGQLSDMNILEKEGEKNGI